MGCTCSCIKLFKLFSPYGSLQPAVNLKGRPQHVLSFLMNLAAAQEVTQVEILDTKLKNRFPHCIDLYANRIYWFFTLSITTVVFIGLHMNNQAEESMRWFVLLAWFVASIIPPCWHIVKRRTTILYHYILKLTYMVGDEEHVNLVEYRKDGLCVYSRFPEGTSEDYPDSHTAWFNFVQIQNWSRHMYDWGGYDRYSVDFCISDGLGNVISETRKLQPRYIGFMHRMNSFKHKKRLKALKNGVIKALWSYDLRFIQRAYVHAMKSNNEGSLMDMMMYDGLVHPDSFESIEDMQTENSIADFGEPYQTELEINDHPSSPQNAIDNASPNTIIDFINHEEERWGVKINMNTNWEIARVDEGRQFDKMGVKVGWKVLRVDNMITFGSFDSRIQKILKKGEPCQIEFSTKTSVEVVEDIKEAKDAEKEVEEEHQNQDEEAKDIKAELKRSDSLELETYSNYWDKWDTPTQEHRKTRFISSLCAMDEWCCCMNDEGGCFNIPRLIKNWKLDNHGLRTTRIIIAVQTVLYASFLNLNLLRLLIITAMLCNKSIL